NIAAIDAKAELQRAAGEQTIARSALLPRLDGVVEETRRKLNLEALGIPIAASKFPAIVGPFDTFDARVRLSQSVLDLAALNGVRSAAESKRAAASQAADTRQAVTLAVSNAYFQVVAAKARVVAASAARDAARAFETQTASKRETG